VIAADEGHRVGPSLFIWHAYDPSVKAELFSTAILCPRGLLLIDPIPLAAPARDELLALAPVGGILVTNANHWRASAEWAKTLKVTVRAHASLAGEGECPFEPVKEGEKILDSAEVISIAGAAPGEIALHLPDNDGSLILGDALIHFAPYGFTFLPAKYCTNHKEMRRSLRALLNYKSERMLFAHGLPILSKARTRLEHLLHDG
jgi:hypothetical protein